MTYSEKFVAVVKVKGKILREHDDIVCLPFGEEYSIFLKNLNTVKAVVSISIDGEDVLNGHQIIVNPNESVNLEGFLKNQVVSHKFKFIQKTKEIQDYRGDKIDDGIIRVEYRFEKIVYHTTTWSQNIPVYPYNSPYPTWFKSAISENGRGTSYFSSTFGSGSVGGMCSDSISASNNMQLGETFNSAPMQDEGITVKGGHSNQKFIYCWTNELDETSSVIVLKLRGINSKGENVSEPIQVDRKIICGICGRSSKSSLKFCGNCGSSLI